MSDWWNQTKTGLKVVQELARDAAKRAIHAAREALDDEASPAPRTSAIQANGPTDLAEAPPEPPVVARLMIEIRSDGSRTIARGALQDELTGEQVAVEAKGNSPLELAGQLAKSLVTAPLGLGQLSKILSTSKKS